MKCVIALVAMLAASAFATCPNSCSGHGSCSDYDICVCDNEDKTSYFGQIYDTTKGYDRIADGDSAVKGAVLAQLRSDLLSDDAFGGFDQSFSPSDTVDSGAYARRRSLAKTAFTQSAWKNPDCSARTCPRGVDWRRRHPEFNWLHADFAECSGIGSCSEGSGECTCPAGFEGKACQRSVCVNGCSGNGICRSNVELAAEAGFGKEYLGAWDAGIYFGCKCSVGFRGEDCSMRECPSGSDPEGAEGNNSGRDCSGRGLCDYSSGECACFPGYTSHDCSTKTALA